MSPKPIRSMTSENAVGSATPRLWTPPLRDLTPATSYGFDLIDFSREVAGVELDPWQQWLAIHMGELLPDGRPRFRYVLVLVARQNGKTLFTQVLTLYWMAVEQVPLVLGTGASRQQAKNSWRAVVDFAKGIRWLNASTRETIGEECLLVDQSRYMFAAPNRRAGRGFTVHRLVIDEIREQRSFETWDASVPAMQAVPDAQAVAISNQGDANSVVLDYLRTAALDHLENGTGDPRTGLFEWSAPPGSDPTDPAALGAANPNMGNRIDVETLLGQARAAKAAGGEALASFRTEVLCQRVHLLDAAIDADAWGRCHGQPVDLAQHRDRVALCLDVALDGSHATLVAAAALPAGVAVDVVHAWDGHGCLAQVRRELPDIVRTVRPKVFGWFPQGPAAAIAADLRDRGLAPRGAEIEEIRADLTAVCMGLAEQVTAGEISHTDDPLLSAHVTTAQRLRRGDAWVFTRAGSGPVDAAYAAAGAVHLARTLPPARPPLVAL